MTLTDALNKLDKLHKFGNKTECCVALHDFVRDEISFGFTAGFEGVSPEQTLQLGRGHCNAQADLFRALLNAAGIAARLRFVQLDRRVLRYAVPTPVFALLPAKLFHAVTEVNVEEKWLHTDSYIFHPGMFYRQKEKLDRSESAVGFGLTKEATCEWDATTDAFSQACSEDINNNNLIYPSMEHALREKAGNNRLLGIHFNQWLGCIPGALQRVSERYLNSRLEVR